MNLNKIAKSISAIREKHGTYCTVEIKPYFDRDSDKYTNSLELRTYISVLPQPHINHGLDHESALKRLNDFLDIDDLEMHVDRLLDEKIDNLQNYIEDQKTDLQYLIYKKNQRVAK
jgi:hypothetical protein